MVAKKDAVLAFARANPIDKRIYDIPHARMGIITTGKAHLDLMEALAQLGINETKAQEIGLDIYKMGMVWPIEPFGVREFLKNKEEVLVVEEKRGIIESQLKELLYDYPGDKPKSMVGKYDEYFQPLLSWTEEFSPSYLAPIVARRMEALFDGLRFDKQLDHILNFGRYRQSAGRRAPDGFFLFRLPAQYVDQSARRKPGAGRHRLPFYGFMDGSQDNVADSNGWGRYRLGRQVALSGQWPYFPKSRRGHVFPFRLYGDSPGGRRGYKYHL